MQVVLLDTPGFDDTYKSDGEILENIVYWLAANYAKGHKLTAILYLHSITDARITGSSIRNLEMFKNLIGSVFFPNVMFVTTKWDIVEQAVGAIRENELMTNSSFWGKMVSAGSAVVRFDGTRDCAYNILRQRLNADTKVLTIQKEIIDAKLALAETEAGKVVLAEMTKLKLEHQKDMRQIRSDMEASNERDKVDAQELADKLARAEAQIIVLQSRSPEIEVLQKRHEQELKRLRDSLEDRIGILEQQTNIPPPSYEEAEMTSEENSRIRTRSAAFHGSRILPLVAFYLWALFICLKKYVGRLLRPRVPPGYRRLEWTCVCFLSLSQ